MTRTPRAENPAVPAQKSGSKAWPQPKLWRGWVFLALALLLLLLLVASLFSWPQTSGTESVFWFRLQIVLAVVLFAVLLILGYLLARDLILPAHRIRDWLLNIHAGDLSARLDLTTGEWVFPRLEGDLNTMVKMLEAQTNKVSEQLRRHMEHVAEKTRFLATLYSFVTSINTTRGLDELLRTMMKTLEDVLGVERVLIRKNFGDGQMMKLAAKGMFPKSESCFLLPLDSPWLQNDEQQSRLVVEMRVHGRRIGVCVLYLEEKLFARRKELAELFSSLARHLGMAIEACRLAEESHRLSVLEERARIGREVHDSLAQTISSIRLQVCTLCRHVEGSDHEEIPAELRSLDAMVRTADREVRELIGHFRTPLQKTTDLPGVLRNLVGRFRHENPGIRFYFHNEESEGNMLAEHGAEVQMIVQEALTNAVKHAAAKNVRVLMGRTLAGRYVVLVEDDGVGTLDISEGIENGVGRHYGMSVMTERAQAIGGSLDIHGEPGEGVCVRLEYSLPNINTSESGSRPTTWHVQ